MTAYHLYYSGIFTERALRSAIGDRSIIIEPLSSAKKIETPAVVFTDYKTFLRRGARIRKAGVRVIIFDTGRPAVDEKRISAAHVHAVLPHRARPVMLAKAYESACTALTLALSAEHSEKKLTQISSELRELNHIGIALSAENDVTRLLNLILVKSKEMTSADAGSLFIVEENASGGYLRFKLSDNDSSKANYTEFAMPINKKSIAGYVALTGETLVIDDVYQLPATVEYTFNRSFDESTKYYSKSMMVSPLTNNKGKVVGVIQLVNRKRTKRAVLSKEEDFKREVIPFDRSSRDLIQSLASQATVAFENAKLYESIHTIFEHFVKASVTAIEARDPTTSGHSNRVAEYSIALARAVGDHDRGPYASIRFSETQYREIRYASLLHDFGKVGVREHVLTKANKLYPADFEIIKGRYEYVRAALEREFLRKKLETAMAIPDTAERSRTFEQLEKAYEEERTRVKRYFEAVEQANVPHVTDKPIGAEIAEVAGYHYCTNEGDQCPFLTQNEVLALSVERGSLTQSERSEIETHVTHTYKFLTQIPWTDDLRNIPEIAYKHHEKLNGSGYPNKVGSVEIPVQSRIMTIADIFDALTARDRPYKKAVDLTRSLTILDEEVERGNLDAELYMIFRQQEIYNLVNKLI
ncbi:MAG: HD domain-containing phosphohydrolase [Spirochaetota bacterium]